MSSYGHIVMILGFMQVAAQQLLTGNAVWSVRVWVPIEVIFSFNKFLNVHCIVKMTNTELQGINRLMGYKVLAWERLPNRL